MEKISIIGDIMCEPELLELAKRENGYDFHFAFDPLKGLLEEADYRIGNLEMPLAGEEAVYSDTIATFNAPDEILTALKDIGLDFLQTGNNHALDRGKAGLIRTLEELDKAGFAHSGTYEKAPGDRNAYIKAGDVTIGLVVYTYATNKTGTSMPAPDPELYEMINFLRPQRSASAKPPYPAPYRKAKEYIATLLGRKLNFGEDAMLRKALEMPIAYADNIRDPEAEPFLRQMEADIRRAKEKADLVLFLPHTGGQFNTEPGSFSQLVCARALAAGADAVLAAHSHTTQMAFAVSGKACFYSLGNVTMTPDSEYSVMECLPEYGIAAHLYIEKKKIAKTTFSLFKITPFGSSPLAAVPVDTLAETLGGEERAALEADVRSLLTRIAGAVPEGSVIRREYLLGE